MKKHLVLLWVLTILFPLSAGAVTRTTSTSYAARGVQISLAGETSGSVYQPGESIRFSVEADATAYAFVFNIDTEGFVHLLYPVDSNSLQLLHPVQRLTLPESQGDSFVVTGKKGMEFVFAVTTSDRNAISDSQIDYLVQNENQPPERQYRIDGDPFVAANRIAAQLIRGIEYARDVSMAYSYFYVGEVVDFPRYLCKDCYETGADPYASLESNYVATAAFDREDRLAYPLQPAFAGGAATMYVDNLARPQGYDDYDDDGYTESTTRVYVSYYPRWSYGWSYAPAYYWDPWWYPWGWGVGFGYGYGGFSFGVGWRWGGYGYSYYPYYRHGHHYAGYHGGHYGGHGTAITAPTRTLRLRGTRRSKTSGLYAGLNTRNAKMVRYKHPAQTTTSTTQTAAHVRPNHRRQVQKISSQGRYQRHRPGKDGTTLNRPSKKYATKPTAGDRGYAYRGKSTRVKAGGTRAYGHKVNGNKVSGKRVYRGRPTGYSSRKVRATKPTYSRPTARSFKSRGYRGSYKGRTWSPSTRSRSMSKSMFRSPRTHSRPSGSSRGRVRSAPRVRTRR